MPMTAGRYLEIAPLVGSEGISRSQSGVVE